MQGCGSQFFPTNTETFSWLLSLCCPEGRNPGTKRGSMLHFSSPRSYPGGCRFNVGPLEPGAP